MRLWPRLHLALLAACLLLLPGSAAAEQTDQPRRIWTSPAQENYLTYFADFTVDEPRQRIYAIEQGGGRLLVYSLPSMQLAGVVYVGQGPTRLAMSPDRQTLAVLVGAPMSIAIVDLDTLHLMSHLSAGTDSETMSHSGAGSRLWTRRAPVCVAPRSGRAGCPAVRD
jgi:hypothetical protein